MKTKHNCGKDCKFGKFFGEKFNDVGIKVIVTSYRSHWQNGYVERVIGTIKRECLDHFIVFNETHLIEIVKDISIITTNSEHI